MLSNCSLIHSHTGNNTVDFNVGVAEVYGLVTTI